MPGRLVYVMGPSGAGKDSVLAWARERAGGLPVAFAHRYVTRPPEAGGEDHVPLTAEEFETRARAGLFALHWNANGLRYGLGVEIDAWMRAGLTVAANGSRGHLPQCLARYPDVLPVLVTAPPEVLAARLHARGRETMGVIAERLERGAALGADLPGAVVLDNSGPLERAGRRLLELLGPNRP
ncbi:phosphonate metabolism protein/1,5-bisphosphokinase (PRPP-forming) PhnN [Desulfocurvus sp. DL9XJH121]